MAIFCINSVRDVEFTGVCSGTYIGQCFDLSQCQSCPSYIGYVMYRGSRCGVI